MYADVLLLMMMILGVARGRQNRTDIAVHGYVLAGKLRLMCQKWTGRTRVPVWREAVCTVITTRMQCTVRVHYVSADGLNT